jgi:hypothetical protein
MLTTFTLPKLQTMVLPSFHYDLSSNIVSKQHSIMASSQFHLLSLPNELIYRVINHKRPFDFENMLLACKHTYRLGKPLVNDHKLCKSWMLRGKHGFPTVEDEPFKVLEQLLAAPSRLQSWALVYIKSVSLSYCLSRMEPPECGRILTSIQEQAPWLAEALHELGIACPEMEENREVFVFPVANDLDLYSSFSDDDLDSFLYTELESATAKIEYGPNPEFYRVAALTLFTNLQQLFITSMPIVGSTKTLPWLVYRNHGRHIFQQLEELKLQATTSTTLNDISSWLLLPRLRALLVVGIGKPTPMTENESVPSCTSRDGEQQSRLEYLVFLKATANVDAIGEILKGLASLRTFIWEDDMCPYDSMFPDSDADSRDGTTSARSIGPRSRQIPKLRKQTHINNTARDRNIEKVLDETLGLAIRGRNGFVKNVLDRMEYDQLLDYYGEIVARKCDGMTLEEVRNEHWETLVICNQEDMPLDRGDEKLPTAPLGLVNESLLFKPNQLLCHLLSTQHDKLEHLVLTITIKYRHPLILRQYQIDHFKGFTRLTHLEFDSRIVRGTQRRYSSGSPKIMPQSLAEVLPQSIEVVRINIHEGYFQNIHAMLRDLPKGKQNFPRLRLIVIRYTESGSPFETLTRIQPLQDQLSDVRIYLKIVELGLGEIKATFPITLDRDEDGNDMRNFWDENQD